MNERRVNLGDYLESLQDRLDQYRWWRTRLIAGGLLLVLCIVFGLIPTLPDVLQIALLGGSAVFAVVLVRELVRLLRFAHDLEAAVEDLKYAHLRDEVVTVRDDTADSGKRKNDELAYTVGDDGELVPLDELLEDESRRRMGD